MTYQAQDIEHGEFPAPERFFLELGHVLRWKPWMKVLMLWGYFDESGLHGTGGALRKLTVGGCLARRDAWDILVINWAGALKEWGIQCFHMADFEARRPPFETWTDKQRKDRLNALLEMIGATKAHCYSFTNLIREDDNNTAKIYERCVHDSLLELGMADQEMSLVFAHHPEYGRHKTLLAEMLSHGMRGNFKSCTTSRPIELEPLQAADIIAYEMCREEREDGRPQRYPLVRLAQLGCTFRLGSAVE